MYLIDSGRTWLSLLSVLGAMPGTAALAAEVSDDDTEPALVVPDESADGDDSTVVYPRSFFEAYSPVSASDMLDRIPGISLDGGGGGGGRGLGTGGNLLIDGQRIAGKDNSPRDQLDRIAAGEVERIEIIRGTSGDLAVRGSGQVINVVLTDAASRSSTSVEVVGRRNHDGQYEAGGSVSYSMQSGGLQALVTAESRPNYENRVAHETAYSPDGEVLETLRESNIRDQQPMQLSTSVTWLADRQRLQLNGLYEDSSYERPITRDFVDYTGMTPAPEREEELTDWERDTWELGGEYEYDFGNGRRFQFLFIANDETENNVRERFDVLPPEPGGERRKNLFIDSDQRVRERIGQVNYSFPLAREQSLRIGLERADTRLDSSLLIGNEAGSAAASDDTGGLPPRPDLSNPGTTVEEMRYEGFAFHNWALNEKMSLESSLFYETSEISQSGSVSNSRRFNFLRPSLDLRYDITDSFQVRATVQRNVSQLSFENFAATTDNDDRDRDATAGNPELVPETEIRYEFGVEYRLPDDNGVLQSRVVYRDIEDYIDRINATVDPQVPLSAEGNVGDAERWGIYNDISTRLSYFGLPDAIVTAQLNLFDSRVTDPFLGTEQRINGRGFGSVGFRHDVTDLRLNYGLEYNHPIHGGEYDVDITTITRNDGRASLDLFISKVMFDDVTFRLESNNTLDGSRCRVRQRWSPSTIDGVLEEIEDSCSSRFRRLTLRVQTTF